MVSVCLCDINRLMTNHGLTNNFEEKFQAITFQYYL